MKIKNVSMNWLKIVTDKTGIAITNPLAVEKLYYIKETKAPQGYRIPQDAQGKRLCLRNLYKDQ